MLWMLESIAIGDIVDIFLLSYIIYRALLILRGTRAVQSIYGLLILVLLFSLSAQFELHSIYWLLDKFFVYFVLAIIILFQEDIRRGLARAGSLFPSIDRGQDINTLEALIKISFELASRRIGAIIAIDAKRLKKTSLGPKITEGRRITAFEYALNKPASPAALLLAYRLGDLSSAPIADKCTTAFNLCLVALAPMAPGNAP